MRRVRSTSAVLFALAALASCTSSDGSTERSAPTTTTAPSPPPEGVLVPGGSIVLGANDAEVDASFDDDAFQFTAAVGDRSVSFVSEVGTHLAANGMPVRCGDAARAESEPMLDQATKVSGARAHTWRCSRTAWSPSPPSARRRWRRTPKESAGCLAAS